MRAFVVILALVLAGLLSACQEATGPTDPLAGGDLSASTRNSFMLPIYASGQSVFVDCANDGAGEDLLYVSGFFNTTWSWTTTASGNQLWNVLSDYDTGDPLVAIGQSSGDVWTLVRGEGNSNWVRKADAPKKVNDHFQAYEWYVNQDGETFYVHFRFTRQRDLDGNIKNSTYVETIDCIGN